MVLIALESSISATTKTEMLTNLFYDQNFLCQTKEFYFHVLEIIATSFPKDSKSQHMMFPFLE
jgi:hypothetical protein